MFSNTNRRDFMKQSAALSTAFWVGSQTAYAQPKSPLEKLNFACIGIGGKGSSDSEAASRNGNIVAICDIDDNRLAKRAKGRGFRNADKFNDYRIMLEKMDKEIDAVTVSTADHSHAPAGLMAMKLGKHCFCQKPLTWSMKEARMMREMAAEKKVATQMGNQGTANPGLREAVEVVRDGAIGEVREVHVWTNRPVWPSAIGRPEGEKPVPKGLHWELFLGPAKERPYNEGYTPFNWRGWVDYGTGALGDMACHTANMVVMALDLFDAESVELQTEDGIFEGETYPSNSRLKFEFPARGALPPVTMYWHDGGNMPAADVLDLPEGIKRNNSGSLLVGSKGKLYSPNDYGAEFFLLPEEKFADYKRPEPSLPRSPGHFDEFVIACTGGEAAMSNFDYAGRLTETILLGNLALHAGPHKKVEWDAKTLTSNMSELDQWVMRDYKPEWQTWL